MLCRATRLQVRSEEEGENVPKSLYCGVQGRNRWARSSSLGLASLNQASLVAQVVKNLPAMRKTWVWSLGWEDPLEESMTTHSSILAWRIPMDRGTWQAAVHGVAESDMTEWLSTLPVGARPSQLVPGPGVNRIRQIGPVWRIPWELD